jgi:hypothetical protein
MGRMLHVLAVGKFGQDFASQLGLRIPSLKVTSLPIQTTQINPQMIPIVDLNILALWHHASGLLQQLDEFAYLHKSSWLPVVYDHPYIEIGPVIVPEVGPCYSCFKELELQGSSISAYTREIYDYYDRNPEAGPRGSLPAFSGWAAAIVAGLQSYKAHSALPCGYVWKMHVISRRIYQFQALSDMRCKCCLTNVHEGRHR